MKKSDHAWSDEYKREVLEALAAERFATVFGVLEEAKPSGDGWMLAKCPLHKDNDPSLGYSPETGAWSCFAGCGKGDAFEFRSRLTDKPFRDVLFELGDLLGVPRPGAGDQVCGEGVYDYRDEHGTLLFQVIRGMNKRFWQRRPDERGDWINNLHGVRRVLYRLPDLAARTDEMVHVVEGEKDADRLHEVGLLATTNPGGAGRWSTVYTVCMRDRDIVIIPDNDKPGQDHAQKVAASLHGTARSVRIAELPDLPSKADVTDWLDAGHTVEELVEIVQGTEEWGAGDGASTRPIIQITDRQLRDVIDDAWSAVLAQNDPPSVFVSSGQLSRLVNDGEGRPVIQHFDEPGAYGLLIRVANWESRNSRGTVNAKPPKEVARDFLAYPHPDLPRIDAVVTTPVFSKSGSLIDKPGYHPDARLWMAPSGGSKIPQVPDTPTSAQVEKAVTLLSEHLLVDFPFAEESDEAHALAALILPFARRMIDGPTPIHLIEAPTPGSGKSLLADLISMVATGHTSEATTVTRNEDEARKKITAVLARGRPVVTIDNVKGGLESAQLASAITAEIWSDRILGKTQMVDFPNRALWLVTGNNPNLTMEIARRCVRIRLEPGEERPWERSGFTHDPIRTWAKDKRESLVWAVLVLIQGWVAAGRKPCNKTLGSFEDWAGVIGGILAHAGIRDFLEDTAEFYEAADSETGEWNAFIAAWRGRFDTSPVTPSALMAMAEEQGLVAFALGARSENARLARFGKALASLRNRKFGDVQVAITRNSNRGSNDYRLVPVAGELFRVTGGA